MQLHSIEALYVSATWFGRYQGTLGVTDDFLLALGKVESSCDYFSKESGSVERE